MLQISKINSQRSESWINATVIPSGRGRAVEEKRIAPRHRVLKAGFIVISEKAPKLECTVRNLSETGAGLKVSTTFGLPRHFDLIVDGVRHRCRSVWWTDTQIGIAFE
jgi:hypothetical protein